MIEQTRREVLEHKVDRANHIIQGCLIGILCIVVIMLAVVLWQQQVNLEKSRDVAAENHKRTREYVLCVANTLSVPIASRTQAAIDKCTLAADNQTLEADKQGK